jgi:sugar-specific transcriptional regulator TrmB
MNLSEKLVQLGLSKNVARVYEALIELGQSKASAIIKQTGLHRNIVYESLDELTQRKLAFKSSKGNVALFQLSDANSLVSQAQSQLSLAQEVTQHINSTRDRANSEIKIYEGISGLRAHRDRVFEEIGENPDGDELLVLGENAESEDMLYESFWKDDDEKRADKKIPLRILYSHGNKEVMKQVDESPYSQARFLPQEIQNPTMVDIWKDNIGIMTYDNDPLLISIKNQKLASSFREYFETLWNKDTQVLRGEEGIKQVMEESLEYKHNWFIGGNGGIHRVMPEYWADYNKRRIEKSVWWHDLVDQDTRMPGIQHLSPGTKDDERFYEFKWLPEDVSSPSVMFLYGHTVANITWEADGGPIAFVIENQEVFNSYHKYFEYLWNQDTNVVSGLKNMQNLFYRKMRAMKKGEKYHVLWASWGEEPAATELKKWFTHFHNERIQRQVGVELLLFEENRSTIENEIRVARDGGDSYSHIRYVQEEGYGSPMQVSIYPDSVILFYWGDGSNSRAIEITTPGIRDAMLAYFHGVWAGAAA